MEDYHVFSSENLTDWKDHGVIVTRRRRGMGRSHRVRHVGARLRLQRRQVLLLFSGDGPGEGNGGGMQDRRGDRGQALRAIQAPGHSHRRREGNRPRPCSSTRTAALTCTWSGADKLFIAKLKPNMLEIEGEPQVIDNLPKKGLQEGPFVFERNGIYYLTYPHVANKIERLEYATSTSPMGPFKWAGVILDESASGCWTVHHSLLEYQGQWYLFYHDRDLSPRFRQAPLDPRGQVVLQCRRHDPESHADAARCRTRAGDEPDPDRPLQCDAARGRRGFVPGRRESARRLEDHIQRREVVGAIQRGRLRPRRAENDRGARQVARRRRARDPPGQARRAVARPCESRPGKPIGKSRVSPRRTIPAGVHDLFVTQAGAEAVEVDWVSFR